jgi:hypothetical protein
MDMFRRVTRSLAQEIDAERRDRQRADFQFEERQNNFETALAKCQEEIQALRNELAKVSPTPSDSEPVKKICKCGYCRGTGHNRVTCALRREHLGGSAI